MNKNCHCELAGYCLRFGKTMSIGQHRLCQTREDYRTLWDQQAAELAAQGKIPARGLGDTIARGTTILGIKPCGSCTERQSDYNERFPYKRRA